MISTQATGPNPKYYKTARRQNRSCDQCRRSKRACDAILAQWTGCSNCLRLGKPCSFEGVRKENGRNANAQLRITKSTKGVEPSSGTSSTERSRSFGAASHQRPHSYRFKNVTASSKFPLASYFGQVDSIKGLHRPLQTGHSKDEYFPFAPLPNFVDTSIWPSAQDIMVPDRMNENFNESGRSNSLGEVDSLYPIFGHSSDGTDNQIYDFEETTSAESGSVYPRRTSSLAAPRFELPAHHLAEKTNKSLISASLKHIYSDTLERALLCWVTEQSCPYNNEGIFIHRGPDQLYPGPNRVTQHGMIRRIQRLDRASCVLNERPLTPRESRLASHALHATTMAFAAQWSQLGGGSASELLNGRADQTGQRPFQEFGKLIDASLFDFAEVKLASFDRSLQETLWNEARRALQDAIGVESFQVAFAQVLFGFTQRPLSRNDFLRIKNHGKGGTHYFGSSSPSELVSSGGFLWDDDESVFPDSFSEVPGPAREVNAPESTETQELLDLDKDPLHLRDSLMRLSARRVRLSGTSSRHDKGPGSMGMISPSPGNVDSEFFIDRMTFNQLF